MLLARSKATLIAAVVRLSLFQGRVRFLLRGNAQGLRKRLQASTLPTVGWTQLCWKKSRCFCRKGRNDRVRPGEPYASSRVIGRPLREQHVAATRVTVPAGQTSVTLPTRTLCSARTPSATPRDGCAPGRYSTT